jgi:hypothetical protein
VFEAEEEVPEAEPVAITRERRERDMAELAE